MNRLQWLLPVLVLCLTGCDRPTPVDEITTSASELAPAPAISVSEQDWPWWRGYERNGHAPDQPSPPVSWSSSENVMWRVEIPGRGNGSPTVVADRIFLATSDERNETQSVLALHRETGDRLWETTIHEGGLSPTNHQHSSQANGTVACDGERLFILFLNGGNVHATALDLNGGLLWQTDVGAYRHRYGYAPSPLIYESLVICGGDNRGGGFLAAVHRETGDIVWRRQRPDADTFSSPVVAHVAGRDQVLISGAARVAAYDPQNGDQLWSCPGAADSTCGTLVWDDQRVFASGGYPQQQTICIDAGTGSEVWSNRTRCYEQSLLVHDGHLYAVDENNTAYCWEAETGAEKWRGRLHGRFSASPIVTPDGNIYASNETGDTFIFRADPSAFTLVAENRLGDEAFATPAVCGGRIYFRVAETAGARRREYLYCIGSDGGEVAALQQ
jgi:outer membrane protein assembly factor BamB